MLILSPFSEVGTASSPLSLEPTARWGRRSVCELVPGPGPPLICCVTPFESLALSGFLLPFSSCKGGLWNCFGSVFVVQPGRRCYRTASVRALPGGRRTPEPSELLLFSSEGLGQGGRAGPVCRRTCPGDFSPWCVSPAGEADPVHHGPPQRHQEGDRGEPLPVSRAAGGTGALGENSVSCSGTRGPQEGPGPAT